jgi:hypothetical protein
MHLRDPQSLHVQVIGGPLGTGSLYQTSASGNINRGDGQEVLNNGDDQGEATQGYQMEAMSSRASRLRNEVLAREKLLERCSFMNSLAAKLGV